MNFEFLSPVEDNLIAENATLPRQALGNTLQVHSKKTGIPDLEGVSIAIVSVSQKQNTRATNAIRSQLYRLFPGNWNSRIADLGILYQGATQHDTDMAVKELTAYLIKIRCTLILIGNSQALTYATYRGFDGLGKMVTLVAIDQKFDFGDSTEIISPQSYMSRIIAESPINLLHFSNLGYQTYYNAQEEIDLSEKLFFDAYRLGEITHDLSIAEPVLRDADIVSVDMTAIESSATSYATAFPNGLSSREICSLSRYAGISDRVSVFGIYESADNPLSHTLIAQMIWYFIEGYNYRISENPPTPAEQYTKFIVPVEGETLHFYKSSLSNRWWMEAPQVKNPNNKSITPPLLPCTHQDYLNACNQSIPERWWKAYKKTML